MIASSLEEKLFGDFALESVNFNEGAVVVGHPHFKPAVLVEVGKGKSADGAAFVFDKFGGVLKGACVACWVQDAHAVVTVSCDCDVGAFCALGGCLRPDGVGEAWSHVGNRKAKLVFETSSKRELLVIPCHDIFGHGISPDSISFVVLFVVVHDKLLRSITVQVNH